MHVNFIYREIALSLSLSVRLRLFLLHFSIPVVPLFSSYIIGVFPMGLFCHPDLFSLNRFMSFEHRYTTVAFIYIFVILASDI